MKSVVSQIVLTVLVSVLTCFVLFASFGSLSAPAAVGGYDTLFKSVQKEGRLRAAYFVGAPLFMIDPNTKQKSGLFYDIVEAAAERLGLKVAWTEEVGYGNMIEGLQGHRYDIVGSGVWINAQRAREADFSIPLFYDALFAYARKGDARFAKGLSVLNDKRFKISVMDGELGASVAQKDFPLAQTLQLPQSTDFTQLIQNVETGKADIVFLSAAAMRTYQAVRPGKIVLASDKPLRVFGNAILLPQGEPSLKQALNVALVELMNDGTVDALLRKYEKTPNSFLRVSSPYNRPESSGSAGF